MRFSALGLPTGGLDHVGGPAEVVRNTLKSEATREKKSLPQSTHCGGLPDGYQHPPDRGEGRGGGPGP